jgi:archaeosine synthase beta-subunit
VTEVYPSSARERTRWILERRGKRNGVVPERPYAFFLEREMTKSRAIADVATVFLTNRECPWKCVMCDLWHNTTEKRVPVGAIPQQIRWALSQLPSATILKLYNSGSFFDEGAIPQEDWREIAAACRNFSHLIVECHPRLIGPKVLEFLALVSCTCEIAMGLETAHTAALSGLNKRITIADYGNAARFLVDNGIAVRTFLLVHPPFVAPADQIPWLKRSIELAFECGSQVVSLIPLRGGNGAMEELISQNLATEPTLAQIEAAQELGIALNRDRVFTDTWDLERFAECPHCMETRVARISRINLAQQWENRVACSRCG